MADKYGSLNDYHTGARMRAATREQRDASREAAKLDGGAGVILVGENWDVLRADDVTDQDAVVRCFVQE